jgi:hypothetical protein
MRPALLLVAALPLLPLAGCGGLPEPFRGRPGALGAELAKPPMPPRLVVPAPPTALLPDAGSHALAALLARDLQLREVPAYAEKGQRADWRLVISAEDRGSSVVPIYIVQDPQGHAKGKLEGRPVPLAQWAGASPATLERVAADAAPPLTAMLSGINTALQQGNPNSLYNRVAKVDVAEVTGAPGDGDSALTRLMRTRLTGLGEQVQDGRKSADFTVAGHVRVVPIAPGQERVEIQWIVRNALGDERGRVVQLNVIPAGTLDHYWGDVAEAVAQEASGGVRDVILRQSGRK